MNSFDYAKQLTKDRTYYRDAASKTNEAAKKKVEQLEDQHSHIQKKMKESHIKDVTELSNEYKENIEKVREKTAEALEGKKELYGKSLKEQQENFEEYSENQRNDFSKRLSQIRSSYNQNLESLEEKNDSIQKSQKERYAKNIGEVRKDTENKVNDFQQKVTTLGENIKQQSKREKEQLIASHEDKIHSLQKSSAKELQDTKSRMSGDLAKMKSSHEETAAQAVRYNDGKIQRLQSAYEDRYQSQVEDFSRKTHEINEQIKDNNLKANKEHQEEIAKIDGDYNKKLRFIENERRRESGSGELGEIAKTQLGLTEKAVADNKYKRLADELAKTQADFSHKAEEDLNNYKTTLKQEASDAVILRERQVEQLEAEKLQTVAKERQAALKKINQVEEVTRNERANTERQLMLERDGAANRITKLKDNYNKSMTKLEEKHLESMQTMKETSVIDKHQLMAKAHEERNEEIFNLKRDFASLMDKTVQDYENRLAKYERDNEYLKTTMNQKISDIVYQTDRKLESQTKLYEQKKTADAKSTQLLMDQRESTLKREKDQLIANFQKKLDRAQLENNSKLKLITNDYEAKLKELKASTSQEIAQKDNQHLIEQQRVKEAYEAEKARLVSTYENQIDSLKQGHQKQLDSLSEYKRLS